MSIPKKTFKVLVFLDQQTMTMHGRFEKLSTKPVTISLFKKSNEELVEFYLDIFSHIGEIIRTDAEARKLVDHQIEIFFSDTKVQEEFEKLQKQKNPELDQHFVNHFINLGNQSHKVMPAMTLEDINKK